MSFILFLKALWPRVIHGSVILAMLVTQGWQAYARTIKQGAAEGMKVGQQTRKATVSHSGSDFIFNAGTGNELKLQNSDIFPQDTMGGSGAENYFGDNEGVLNLGDKTAAALSTGTNSEAQAYQTLIDYSGRKQPDFTKDPVFGRYDQVTKDIDSIAKDFTECSLSTTQIKSATTAHVPDYKTCERVDNKTGAATLYHDYKVGIIRHITGPLNLASCGSGCTKFWLGKIGDNYWSGNCAIYEQSIVLELLKPEAVIRASLDYMKWDDYQRVHILDWTKDGEYTGEDTYWHDYNGWILSVPDGKFPPETGGACELATEWEWNKGLDITRFMNTGRYKKILIRTSVGVKGEGYARGHITYNPNDIVTDKGWSPDSAMDFVRYAKEGFCSLSARCVKPTPVDAQGCATINNVRVCEDQMEPSPFEGISPFCRQVQYTAKCDFNIGQMDCWTDASGRRQCPSLKDTSGQHPDTCKAFEKDKRCGFISSSCVDGAKSSDGTCFVQEETWDCGYDTTIPTAKLFEKIDCEGPVACMGTQCMQPATSQSSDFATAAAAFEAAKYMAMDTTCTKGDRQNVICTVFKGKGSECKKAVGGIVNCCKTPESGVSLANYISLVSSLGMVDTLMKSSLAEGTAVQGAWSTLTSAYDKAWSAVEKPFAQAWSAVQKPFVQAWESVSGTTEATAGAAKEGVFSYAKQKLMQKTAQWVADTFGPQAANVLFSTTSGTAAFDSSGAILGDSLQLGGGGAIVGTALSWVMTAYMIYELTMVLIHLIWPCEKSEFELSVKRQLKSCTHVGSYCKTKILGQCIEKREAYCCFNSPLSRILQEQIRKQRGISWGGAKNPRCDGLGTDTLAAVDWSKIDLSEWMALLNIAGALPSNHTSYDTLYSQQYLDTDGTRKNAVQRTQKRVGGLNTSAIRRKAAQELGHPHEKPDP